MKTAILSTFVNLEIANHLSLALKNTSDVTLYYKRGNEFLKQNKDGNTFVYNRLKIDILKDVRKEKFDHIIVVELPNTSIRIFPYFVMLALLGNAKKRSVYLENGTYIPVTPGSFIWPVIQLISVYLKSLAVLPIVISNLLFLILMCAMVDLISALRSKAKT